MQCSNYHGLNVPFVVCALEEPQCYDDASAFTVRVYKAEYGRLLTTEHETKRKAQWRKQNNRVNLLALLDAMCETHT